MINKLITVSVEVNHQMIALTRLFDCCLLNSQDYFDIVKKPMDLSTIRRKLDSGMYKDPWEYVDDVWQMFDNAWLYNRKTSRVYKYASRVSEVKLCC